MISLAPPTGGRCVECKHPAETRILHRHLDGGQGSICAAFLDRDAPDNPERRWLCGCPCTETEGTDR